MKKSATVWGLALSLLCGWMSASNAAQPAPQLLSPRDRTEVFETVWKTINDDYYNFAFNAADWATAHERYHPRIEGAKTDEEFYAQITQMIRELHDLHTGFAAPNGQALNKQLSVNEVEGKVVVVRVEPDSEAARAGVQAGMIVQTFNGKPAAEQIAKLRSAWGHSSSEQADRMIVFGSFLNGPVNTQFTLGLRRADGTSFEAVLTRQIGSRSAPALTAKRLPSGFHYLKINEFRAPVDGQFKTEFANFKNAPGLIIDLRGVTGGNVHDIGLKIAEYFFQTRVSFGRFVNRSGETPMFRSLNAAAGAQVYQGPVVILVDEATRSAGEVFASGFQENGRAPIIGHQSCGCVADVDSKKLKGGGVLQYSHLGYFSGKGRKLEGTGVIPDKTVPLTIAALRQGRDEILEEAERNLKSR
jgi:carboxyl-terminal processing protease